MNKPSVTKMINKEADIYDNRSYSFENFMIVIAVLFALVVVFTGGNLVFFVLFMLVVFSEMCLMALKDFSIQKDLETNRLTMLKELFSDELKQVESND